MKEEYDFGCVSGDSVEESLLRSTNNENAM